MSSYIEEKLFVVASVLYGCGCLFLYEKVRRTMRTAIVSYLLNLISILAPSVRHEDNGNSFGLFIEVIEDVLYRSNRSQMIFKTSVIKKFHNIHRKTPVVESFYNKVAALKA